MSFDRNNIRVGDLIRSNNYDYDYLITGLNFTSKIPTISFLSRKIIVARRKDTPEVTITEEVASLDLFLQRGYGEIMEPERSRLLKLFKSAVMNPATKFNDKQRARINGIVKDFVVLEEVEAA